LNAQKAAGIVKIRHSLEIQTEVDALLDDLPAGTAKINRLAAILNHLKTHYSPVQTNDVNRIKNKLAVVNDFCGIEMSSLTFSKTFAYYNPMLRTEFIDLLMR
jgi:hypothetical protein